MALWRQGRYLEVLAQNVRIPFILRDPLSSRLHQFYGAVQCGMSIQHWTT